MLVKEKSEVISSVLDKLFNFVQQDETVKSDFNDYLAMLQVNSQSQKQIMSILMPYIFERKIGKDRVSVLELFGKNADLDKEQKAILKGFKKAQGSVFQIRKILKDGFELYNLVNEAETKVLVLDKMTSYRGVASGQYLVGRIFPFEDEFYLIEANEVISYSGKEKAYRLAVAKQMQNPSLLFEGNPSKLKEVKKLVKQTSKKFDEFFGGLEVITTSKHVDNIISAFNDFIEEGIEPNKEEIEAEIKQPENFSYFDVPELTSGRGDFLESASKGFSSHKNQYDVGVVYNADLGLFVVPFLATFRQIFKEEDPKNINGYADCIKSYLNSVKIPPSILINAYNENNEKFLNIINEVTESEFSDINEVIEKYKSDYQESKMFSSTTVLYASKAFQEIVNYVGEEEAPVIEQKVGRNEPCPCGSGKKFKKCCLSKVI